MPKISSDSPETTATLRRLADQVRQAGGWINDRIVLDCIEGNLTVRLAPAAAVTDNLLALPPECLIPIEEVSLCLDGDELAIESHMPQLAPQRLALLETMLTLFNQTGKVTTHKATSPWSMSVSARELFRELLRGRSKQVYQELQNHIDDRDTEQLIIGSLLKTRVIGFTTRQDSERRTQMLMPVADLVNHHPLAPTYTNFVDQRGHSQLVIKAFYPDPQTRECFVRYGYYDALDLYLTYGYVDTQTFFVRSVPLEIDLEGHGTLKVHSLCAHPPRRNLPPQIADLDVYLPNFTIDHGKKCAEASFLLIPQASAPYALRRVLSVILANLTPGVNQQHLKQLIEIAETRILDQNRSYYQRLLQQIESPAPTDTAPAAATGLMASMANLQLSKLDNYPLA